jgi:hypothetical protein
MRCVCVWYACHGTGSVQGKEEAKTYQDRGADKHQVPDKVLLAREARIALFQLAHVLVYEVRIEEHAQLGRGDEKARDRPPDLGKKPEEKLGRVDKIVSRDEPKVHSDGQQEGDRGGSPGPRSAAATGWYADCEPTWQWLAAASRHLQRPPYCLRDWVCFEKLHKQL